MKNKLHAFNLNNLFDIYFNLFYQIKEKQEKSTKMVSRI